MPTSVKEALAKWQEAHPNEKLAEAKYVGLQFQVPPLDKMDNSLSVLQKCEKLSLSTNTIDKITGISALKHLKILSLARNSIKSFAGLDALSESLEQLWMSYNLIEKTRGIDNLQKLKVLYLSNNLVKSWSEFDRFGNLPVLEDFLFFGNPLYDSMEFEKYRNEVLKRMPSLKKLEGEPIVGLDDEEEDAD